jgi:hypothetical protein
MISTVLLSLALSQGLSTSPPGGTSGGKVLWSAPFATPGCYATGSTAGASSAIATTRASLATYVDAGSAVQTCQAGEFRVAPDGLLVEPAGTNYALQSNTMSTGTAATAPWVLYQSTVATVAGAPVGGTWAEVTSGTAQYSIYQAITTPSSTAFVMSAWASKASGTGSVTVAVRCPAGNPSACACLRSDGGACTATSLRNPTDCESNITGTGLGTTAVRLSALATCSAGTVPVVILYPADNTAGAGTTRFSGAQLEIGTYPTSLIVTAGTAVARNADTISATVPAVPAKWTLQGSFKPTHAWSSGSLWGLGTAAGANSASLVQGATDLVLSVIDNASGAKTCTVAPGFASGSTQLVKATDKAGTLLRPTGCVQAGAGTGLFVTPPTTLYIGTLSSTGTEFGGFIKSLKVVTP